MNSTLQTLTPEVLAGPVRGRHLQGTTLAENLAQPTLLAFLRHFG